MSDRGRNGQAFTSTFPFSRVAPWFTVSELVRTVEDAGGAVINQNDSNGNPTEVLKVFMPRGHQLDYDTVEILKFGEGCVANVPMPCRR